jgi:hypothetical protein
MTYGKVVNGVLTVAPKQIKVNGRLIASPRSADYKKAGYLPIDPTNAPPEGYKWADQWEEKDGKIVKKYVEIPQEEQDEISRMVILSGDEAAEYEEAKDVIDALEEVFG